MSKDKKTIAPLEIAGKTVADPACLSRIAKASAWLDKIEDDYKNVPDVTTVEGLRIGQDRLSKLVKAGTTLDKARLASTKEMRDEIDRVNGLVNKGILPRIKALREPLEKKIKAVLEKEAAAKKKKDDAKAERDASTRRALEELQLKAHRVSDIEEAEAALIWLDTADELLEETYGEHAEEAGVAINRQMELVNAKLAGYLEAAEAANKAATPDAVEELRSEVTGGVDRLNGKIREMEAAPVVTGSRGYSAEIVDNDPLGVGDVDTHAQVTTVNKPVRMTDQIATDEWILKMLAVPAPMETTDEKCNDVISKLLERMHAARKYIGTVK